MKNLGPGGADGGADVRRLLTSQTSGSSGLLRPGACSAWRARRARGAQRTPEPPAHSQRLPPSSQRTVSASSRPARATSAQSVPPPAPSPRGWTAHPTGAHVCDRQTEGPKGVHSAGSVPVPLAEGVRCLWGGLASVPPLVVQLT